MTHTPPVTDDRRLQLIYQNALPEFAAFADPVHNALARAIEFHGDQTRKFSGTPYIVHPIAVAKLVMGADGNAQMISAALLHDVVEDTAATNEDVRALFGAEIAELVYWLTDKSRLEDGNRKVRKAIDRDHIAAAPVDAKTIKLADVIDNTSSIVDYDPGFAKVYLREKRALLDVLGDGDAGLYAEAVRLCADGERRLAIGQGD